jgi:cytosine/adenosine deaminase-related metal-dependent hydrolase
LIGDIAAAGASWTRVCRAACRAIVFFELIGLKTPNLAYDDAERWLEETVDDETHHRGLSPHAPYSVHQDLFGLSNRSGVPLTVHLAESREELQLLESLSGPFVDLLKDLGVWNPEGLVPSERFLTAFVQAVFVHCNYLDPNVAAAFLPMRHMVVCPRTHAAFGHPHHPFPHFLQRGVCVALGTDSLASNPDLDILAEARFLRRHYPEVEPAMLLRMLTLNGAEALGFSGVAGSLTPGKSADLVVLPLPDAMPADPHDLVLDSARAVQAVMFRGEMLA